VAGERDADADAVALTMLNTPAGTPAACMISAKMWPENGATSEGFSTMVQPVAMAGATLQTIWFRGQFQGVMNPQTPIGSLTIIGSGRGLPRT
jgi:hypothetical protein